MKKYLLTTIMFFGLYTLAAQDFGAAAFLNITPDARSIGMGGAGAGIKNSAYAHFHNGAAIMFDENKWAAAYSYFPWLPDNTLHSVAGFYRINNRHGITGGFRYYTYPDVEATDGDGNPLMSFTPAEFSADLGYAVALAENIAVSGTVRYVNSDMGSLNGAKAAGAVAFDLGVMYDKEKKPGTKLGVTAGLSLRNVGTKLKYTETKESIPAVLKAGGSANISVAPKHELTVALDAGMGLYPSDAAGFMAGGGAEYAFMQRFMLRGGYHYGDKDKGNHSYATAGAGLKFQGVNIDFAYLLAGTDTALDDTFLITIRYAFGSKRK